MAGGRKLPRLPRKQARTWLSVGTPSCPSAYSEPHFRNQESRKKLQPPGGGNQNFRVLLYIGRPALNVVRSNNARLNMEQNHQADLLWGWPSAWQNSKGVYSALTFSCTKSHGRSPVKRADDASNVKTFVLCFNCVFLLLNLYFTISNMSPSH